MASRALIVAALALALAATASVAAEGTYGRAVILDELVVDGPVHGDVVAIGGDVRLDANARVHGHAIAVFGTVTQAPGAIVDGRVIALESLASLALAPAAGPGRQTVRAALTLVTFGGWLLLATALAYLFPVRIRYGSWVLPTLGLRVVVLGLLAAVTLIAALVAVLGVGPVIGPPLAAAVLIVFLAVKAVGLTVIGGELGGRLLDRALRRRQPLTVQVFVGVVGLLLLRLLPVIGGAVWTAVSVGALGAGIFALALAPNGQAVGLPLRSGDSPSR